MADPGGCRRAEPARAEARRGGARALPGRHGRRQRLCDRSRGSCRALSSGLGGRSAADSSSACSPSSEVARPRGSSPITPGELAFELEVDQIRPLGEKQRRLEDAGMVAGRTEIGEQLVVGERDHGRSGAGEGRAANGDRVLEAVVAVEKADCPEAHLREALRGRRRARARSPRRRVEACTAGDPARRPPGGRREDRAPGSAVRSAIACALSRSSPSGRCWLCHSIVPSARTSAGFSARRASSRPGRAPRVDGSREGHDRADAAVRGLVEGIFELVEGDAPTDQVGRAGSSRRRHRRGAAAGARRVSRSRRCSP